MSSKVVRDWLAEIDRAGREESKWRDQARKIVHRYRDDEERKGARFNILWSNTETLKPHIYSQKPQPDVRRRYKDADPVGREVAQILERAAEYAIDAYDFDGVIDRVNEDHLLTGRGIARIRYVPTFQKGDPPTVHVQMDPETQTYTADLGEGPVAIPSEQVLMDELGNPYILGEPEDEVAYEQVVCEYVNWEDFRLSPGRTWGEVRWVAFRHRMTKDELQEAFGEKAGEINLDFPEDPDGVVEAEEKHTERRATVWEIWDKKKREIVFVAEGLKDGPVETREDPLRLQGFFPIPEPLYSVSTNNTLVPIPEYTLYQDQALELNRITARIEKLVEALKARGLYAGDIKDELSRLMSGTENELIPVADFAALQGGKLEDRIAWMPIDQIAKTLVALYEQRDRLVHAIYEITGISDIMRGATDPNETMGAQRLKSQFGVTRMQPRQKKMQRFVRDLIEMKIQVMAELFDPRTFERMTGKQITPQVQGLLEDEGLLGFRIDIETDSTIRADDDYEKRNVAEFFNALAAFSQQMVPAIQTGVMSQEAAKELVKFGLRRYRVSRSVEEAFDLPQQPRGPDPVKMAELQNERMKLMLEGQRQSGDMQMKVAELRQRAIEAQDENERHAIDAAIKLAEAQEETFRQSLARISAA